MADTSQTKSVAMAEITDVTTQVAAFAGTIESIEVSDEDTQAQMGQFVKMMTHRRLKLEDKRKSLVSPLNKVVKDINELFKAPRERIDELIREAKNKMDLFAKAQAEIAKIEREQAIEAARKEQAEALELAGQLAEKAGTEAAPVVEQLETTAAANLETAQAPAKVKAVRGEDSTVVVQKRWKAEVFDLAELALAVGEGRLPVTMIEPNMKALTDYARDVREVRDYCGVRFFEDVKTVVR